MTDVAKIAAVTELADRPSLAFKVQTFVFLPESRNTSVQIGRGERLFVLTDNGVDEAPHEGPENILIVTEKFGCWPVVAIRVRDVHAQRWRSLSPDACNRMMARVRAALRDRLQENNHG